ncbi:hypothetical protein GCM10011515_10590 [Tsuneonella deserti]|uniref:TadE-like domain-containing protein n=1 Tax=Tsuneonella deserti TaxID=2035528 RepID=A0ABQ1S674_9SPHN|nr:TadE/TadG family type IV pilus assembly protein [Tsuneonella deserti]GGD92769.1 hypothetical protein GCM10011515_10590 [Tsuneonella deserti]
MTHPKSFLDRIGQNSVAASAVEFALLAPLFFALLFGAIQIGIYMQNYNALRSLAADASRFAAVEYQKNHPMSSTALEDNILSFGTKAPYFLNESRLEVHLTEVTPSTVSGAREFTLDLSYNLPSIAGGIAIDAFEITLSRPVFVLKV